MTSRRRLIAAVLAAAALATGASGLRADDAPTVIRGGSASAQGLTVVYLSADDCSVCRSWERSKRPTFINSPEGRRATIREVSRKMIRQPAAEANWPSDLKWIPGAASIPGATPTFILVKGEKILAVAVGIRGFDDAIVPKIRQM